jgi:uncharacterized protein (DUF2062 family)
MNKLKSKVIELLRQGTSPDDIALTIALGLTLGTIPILGTTTLLCTSTALALRLNVPLIMLVNYFAYPVQLTLYIPLLLLGASLLDSSVQNLSLEVVFTMLRTDLWGAIQKLFWANLGAVLIWGSVAAPLGYLIYRLAYPFMRNFHKTLQTPNESA